MARNPSSNGGTERVVYLLCAALRRNGVDAEVLLANEAKPGRARRDPAGLRC